MAQKPASKAKVVVFVPPDGHWWQNATSEQRDGFLVGYYECAAYGSRQALADVNDRAVIEAVTAYYDSPTHDADRVTAAIAALEARWRRQRTYKFSRADPANEYDGDIWMGGDVKAGYRLAIIEGFMSCQAENGVSLGLHSAMSVEAAVSRWYGTGTEETLAQLHGNDKLGPVILRAERGSRGPRRPLG